MKKIIVIVICLLAGNNILAQKKRVLELEFDQDGKLVSTLPERLYFKKKIKVKFFDETGNLDRISLVYPFLEDDKKFKKTSFVYLYTDLANYLLQVGHDSFFAFNGIEREEIEGVSAYYVLLYQVKMRLDSINSYDSICNSLSHDEKKRLKATRGSMNKKIKALTTSIIGLDTKISEAASESYLMPKISEIKSSYKLVVKGFDAQKRKIVDKSYNIFFNSTVIKLKGDDRKNLSDSDSIYFELSKMNFTNSLLAATPIPDGLAEIIASDEYKAYKKRIQNYEVKRLYSIAVDLVNAADKEKSNSFSEADLQAIIDTTKNLERDFDDSLFENLYAILENNYFYSFLWLTKGRVLANPFKVEINYVDTDQEQTIKQKIEQLKEELILIDSSLALYDKVLPAGIKTVTDVQTLNNNYTALVKSKLDKKEELKTNEEKLKQINKYKTQKSAFALQYRKNSKLIYSGGIYNNKKNYLGLNTKGKEYFMRHHSATDNYDIISKNYKIELPENYRMKVLVHNEDPDNKLSLVTRITTAEQGRSIVDIETDVISLEGVEEDVENVLIKFIRYNNLINIFQYGVLPSELNSISEDEDEPVYVSRLVPHRIPQDKDSTKVNYDIVKNGKEVVYKNGGYRLNKLYRFRVSAGAVYSWLERRDYNIEGDLVSVNTERHGLDATFGLQYHLIRQDIRSPKIAFRPFIYTGFSLSESPIRNWYVGGGIEPVNGLTFSGGLHLGESEKLDIVNDQITTRDRLVAGYYASIAFDLNVFLRFFNFGGASNTLR